MKKQLFLMQKYAVYYSIPNNQPDSYCTCCDTLINLRQSRDMSLFRVVRCTISESSKSKKYAEGL